MHTSALISTTDKKISEISTTGNYHSSTTKHALAKGHNFAVAPTKLPNETIISHIETAIHFLPQEPANNIRRLVANILNKSKLPTHNLTRSERCALKQVNQDRDIILPADKGNTTVIMNKTDYDTKIQTLLTDSTYEKLKKDPTALLNTLTTNLIKKNNLPNVLIPRNAVPPRLYGLPKIHKNNIPLRPIVSAINSPTYDLARFLVSKLEPLTGKTDTTIKNSSDFISKIKNIKLQPNDILDSFDIVFLFTQVPIYDTINIIKSSGQLSSDLISLVEHCLTTTYFTYNNQFYKQITVAAMGSPISPIIANIFMEHFETQAIKKAPLKPQTWYRYVDDTFVIWQHGETELYTFLDFLNKQHPNITFTLETEQHGKLPFLDVLITRKPDGSLGHQIYRKPTHTNRYLHAASHHHPAQKQAVINSLIYRAFTICDKDSIQNELKELKNTLQHNGYTATNKQSN
ncbi:uncharacterized protein LOC109860447 [Pseudomyrmex gracilis]|uniref:uncharacterized protein LOC109860447 n=1 Tax=Pseudomyrmex gracilis TaxID=219809 RepID=UPI000995B4C9|nr:uncharacterized protein LOC109860447 [Pseudomyrmex gracilis]